MPASKFRSWPVLLAAFGCLIALATGTGLHATRQALETDQDVLAVRKAYREREAALGRIQANIFHSAVLVRDYLLDRSGVAEPAYRQSLIDLRRSINRDLDALDRPPRADEQENQRDLRQELDAYWASLDPLFRWTPAERMALSAFFLRSQVLPRRDSVMEMMGEIREIDLASLNRREAAIEGRHREYREGLRRIFLFSGVLSLLIAVACVVYIIRLERRAEASHRRTEQAEEELRKLSQQLVQAQEEERRSLSRELHDEVGQMLTALRIEIGNLDRANSHARPGFDFGAGIRAARDLAERSLQAVRGIALGLRPSMLDDLGLAAALNWQAREFSRRCGVPVTLEVDGALDGLPDAHRTGVYRIVQEALTNCARHAQAKSIRVLLHGGAGGLSLTVQDDGVGFEPEKRGGGLGLVNIEERARKLGGSVKIHSQPRKGSVLTVEIPLTPGEPA